MLIIKSNYLPATGQPLQFPVFRDWGGRNNVRQCVTLALPFPLSEGAHLSQCIQGSNYYLCPMLGAEKNPHTHITGKNNNNE